MKMLISSALIVVACATLFLYQSGYRPNTELVESTLARVKHSISKNVQSVDGEHSVTTVYKWQDNNGDWVYSTDAPPDGVRAISENYRSDANIIPAVRSTNEAKSSAPELTDKANSDKDANSYSPLTPITQPNKISEMIHKTQNLEQVLQNRKLRQDQAIDQ